MRRILDAGLHAATGGNLQPYSIIKIEKASVRRLFTACCRQPFMARAPVHLLFCIDFHRLARWARLEHAPFTAHDSFYHFWIAFQDTIICAQSICTAADALGLGSVYVGTIMQYVHVARRELRLPRHVIPVVLLCLGYRKSAPVSKPKLDASIIVHAETYRDPPNKELLAAFAAKHRGMNLPATPKLLKEFERVCRRVGGPAFAARCVRRVEKDGYFSRVQRYFGLGYRADVMRESNAAFLKMVKRSGFGWFEPFRSPRSSAGKRVKHKGRKEH